MVAELFKKIDLSIPKQAIFNGEKKRILTPAVLIIKA